MLHLSFPIKRKKQMKLRSIISIYFIVHSFVTFSQEKVFEYLGDFNEESTSFGLRINHTISHSGHTHHGEYLINLSSRRGGELYYFRINSEYNAAYSYHLERLSGAITSDDNLLITNTSTEFEMEIHDALL